MIVAGSLCSVAQSCEFICVLRSPSWAVLVGGSVGDMMTGFARTPTLLNNGRWGKADEGFSSVQSMPFVFVRAATGEAVWGTC